MALNENMPRKEGGELSKERLAIPCQSDEYIVISLTDSATGETRATGREKGVHAWGLLAGGDVHARLLVSSVLLFVREIRHSPADSSAFLCFSHSGVFFISKFCCVVVLY